VAHQVHVGGQRGVVLGVHRRDLVGVLVQKPVRYSRLLLWGNTFADKAACELGGLVCLREWLEGGEVFVCTAQERHMFIPHTANGLTNFPKVHGSVFCFGDILLWVLRQCGLKGQGLGVMGRKEIEYNGSGTAHTTPTRGNRINTRSIEKYQK